MPGDDFTFGLAYSSSKFQASSTSTTIKSYATETDTRVFSTTGLTGRCYLGNSFNIPFGFDIYNIHLDGWEYLNTTWELDYSTTQINLGIGNEWTSDWLVKLAIDYYQMDLASKLKKKIL